MMKKVFIKDLKDGQTIEEVFLAAEKILRDFKDKPTKFLQVALRDKTGVISAKCWDDGPAFFELFEEGDFVKVKGKVASYQGSLQIIIDHLSRVAPEGQSLADFVAATAKDINKMYSEIENFIGGIKNPHLGQLLKKIFSDETFVKNFQAAPAGKSWHQAYLGGLLEHTLNVVKICQFVSGLYPEANQDLLLTGAMLHDIGKTQELTYPQILDYTDEGRLVGHISIQDALIAEKIGQIKNFPADLKNLLRHMLLSHHGEKDLGSPKRPKTLEAVILHFADNLDAQAAGFSEIIKRTREKGKSWSDFIKLIDRFVFAGKEEDSDL